jgi:hypothetical protein
MDISGGYPLRLLSVAAKSGESEIYDLGSARNARRGLAFLLLLVSGGPFMVANATSPCLVTGLDRFPPQYNFQGEITPGVSWLAWSEVLDVHWSAAEIDAGIPYNANEVKEAIATIAGASDARGVLPSFYYGDSENYSPPSRAVTDAQRSAYDTAAKAYRGNQWGASIPLFDAIAKDQSSPYRSAAAYSAARAALKAGHLVDGINRVDTIIRDPSLAEFHAPAYHLIGTMAARTGYMPLIAAKYAEMSHMFMAPPELLCTNKVAAEIYEYQLADLPWYLITRRPADDVTAKREVLDKLSAIDPVLDLLRVLAAPTPFKGQFGWPHPATHTRPRPVLEPQYSVRSTVTSQWGDADGTALTAHARERWLLTKNALWGFALAQRTADPADIPLLKDMLRRVDSLPHLPGIDDARPAFYWQYVRHLVRLMVMSGRTEEAIMVVTKSKRSATELGKASPINFSYGSEDGRAIVNGPIYWFLENYDLNRARHWASSISRAIPGAVADGLTPLIARDFTVLVKRGGQAEGFWVLSDFSLRRVADFLPAKKLAELSSMPGLDQNMKRALLGAAFVRLYMLERWPDVKGLLPAMATAFPELKTDISLVARGTSERQRRFLLARLFLRAPGLGPYVSHARRLPDPQSPDGYYNANLDLFSVDSGNPNDGNWWCPPQLEELKVELVNEFYGLPLGYGLYSRDVSAADYRALSLKIADKLIAWHPLLKDVDIKEIRALGQTESGPGRLAEEAVSWADSVPRGTSLLGVEAELPATLHLAVRATRYGCRRAGSLGEVSRAAFLRLHTRFPRSDAARETPYWFNLGSQ